MARGHFGGAAYGCLINRVTRTLDRGDAEEIFILHAELLNKRVQCETFGRDNQGFYKISDKVAAQLQRIDYWLKEQGLEQ